MISTTFFPQVSAALFSLQNVPKSFVGTGELSYITTLYQTHTRLEGDHAYPLNSPHWEVHLHHRSLQANSPLKSWGCFCHDEAKAGGGFHQLSSSSWVVEWRSHEIWATFLGQELQNVVRVMCFTPWPEVSPNPHFFRLAPSDPLTSELWLRPWLQHSTLLTYTVSPWNAVSSWSCTTRRHSIESSNTLSSTNWAYWILCITSLNPCCERREETEITTKTFNIVLTISMAVFASTVMLMRSDLH